MILDLMLDLYKWVLWAFLIAWLSFAIEGRLECTLPIPSKIWPTFFVWWGFVYIVFWVLGI